MQLILITNDPTQAIEADDVGVDRIMIDLEIIGKTARQKGRNLFISNHTLHDVYTIKKKLTHAKLMVRINSIHENSVEELQRIMNDGADIVMLPFIQNYREVDYFLRYLNAQAISSLLIENKESLAIYDDLISIKEVNEIHIGLNDLQLSMQYANIFLPYINGLLENLAHKALIKNKKFGIGGIANPQDHSLPVSPAIILLEQMRLGCNIAWLGRSVRNKLRLKDDIQAIRNFIATQKIISLEQHLSDLKTSITTTI